MQLGMIGLGRMGSDMVRRLIRGGHERVLYDLQPPAIHKLAQQRVMDASSLEDLAALFGNGTAGDA